MLIASDSLQCIIFTKQKSTNFSKDYDVTALDVAKIRQHCECAELVKKYIDSPQWKCRIKRYFHWDGGKLARANPTGSKYNLRCRKRTRMDYT